MNLNELPKELRDAIDPGWNDDKWVGKSKKKSKPNPCIRAYNDFLKNEKRTRFSVSR